MNVDKIITNDINLREISGNEGIKVIIIDEIK